MAPCQICAAPVVPRTNLVDCVVVGIGPWTLVNSGVTAIDLSGARFTVWASDMQPDPRVLSLNGLPPGVPALVPAGTFLPPNGRLQLPLDVQFMTFAPGETFTILLAADTDGDGESEALASMEVENGVLRTAQPTTLAITRGANGGIILTWPDPGWVLQESANASGPYVNVAGNPGSPYTVAPGGARRFYRLVQP